MNISKRKLRQIVIEEYMREEGLQVEAMTQEKADEFYQGYLGFEQGYYSGGVVGQSVQNFNDTIKLLNA